MNIKRERSETAQAGFGALLFKFNGRFGTWGSGAIGGIHYNCTAYSTNIYLIKKGTL